MFIGRPPWVETAKSPPRREPGGLEIAEVSVCLRHPDCVDGMFAGYST